MKLQFYWFYLCRSSLNDGHGLICAYLDQIITLYFTIHECTSILQYPYNLLVTLLLPLRCQINSFFSVCPSSLLSVSDHYNSSTCFKTLYDSRLICLNRCLNQIVFHYTKNNITVSTFQWSSLARGCCVPPSHLYALWICLR